MVPGNALAVASDMPYRGLEKFGVAFLNRFEGSQVPNQVLRNMTLIDTPGVLSGEKQRTSRGYDFTAVTGWFAQRADLILILFDAHKLDISDEFRAVIESLKGNDDKIRCILNKADQVSLGARLYACAKCLSRSCNYLTGRSPKAYESVWSPNVESWKSYEGEILSLRAYRSANFLSRFRRQRF